MEAPPFANFSDAEMRRLLDDERLEVLDWRGKRVDAPGLVEALAADIAVTGNSLAITDGLLEKLSNLKLIVKLSTGLDMIAIPGDTPAATISGIIADEMAIGMIHSKTTAVRVIPAIGKCGGDCVEDGGLFGRAPIMPVNPYAGTVLAHRGGRFPAPLNSLKN